MGLFKKKNEAPPDVGEEEDEEAEEESEDEESCDDEISEENEEPEALSSKKTAGASQASNIELQRIKAQLDSLNSLFKGFSERFSNISERIGEVRSMAMNNEKQISQATKESSKAVDIVKEVKPEKLNSKYQKVDMRVSSAEEKLNAQKQYMNTIMKEVKDIRRKMGVFVGTDALLNLNKEVKNDLFEIQKLGSKVKTHADKSEQIFIELKRILTDNQKDLQKIKTLDSGFSEMKKEIQKLKMDSNDIIDKNTFNKFKAQTESKINDLGRYLSEMESLKKNNQRLKKMIEKIVSIEKRNEEDLKNLSVTVGDDRTQGVKEFENKFNSLLGIIDTLAGEIRELKKNQAKTAEKTKKPEGKPEKTTYEPKKEEKEESEKISIESKKNKPKKEETDFEHIEVHPDIKENLISKKDKENKRGKEKPEKNISDLKNREGNSSEIKEIEKELESLDKQAKKTDSLFKGLKEKLSKNKTSESEGMKVSIDEKRRGEDQSFLESLSKAPKTENKDKKPAKSQQSKKTTKAAKKSAKKTSVRKSGKKSNKKSSKKSSKKTKKTTGKKSSKKS